MNKLNITFCSTPDFTGNAKSLYNYMKNKYNDKMNLVWIVQTKEKEEELSKKSINAITIGTEEFKKYIKTTDLFFTTHCNLTGDITKKSIYVELWHGISSKKIGFMMNNISKKDFEWYKTLSKKIDYMIVPSEFWKIIFAARFNLDLNQILTIGYPKLDSIKDKNAKKNLEKVLNCKLDKYNKIIFYTPTFRKGCGRKDSNFGGNIINLKKYKEKELEEYLKSKNYLLCIKKHPSEESDFLNNLENSENIKLIEEKRLDKLNFDIYNILDASDVLITDYSSLGIEYLFLNKNVIYIDTDKDDYMNNRGICYENFNFWSSNTAIDNISDLKEKIDNYLEKDNFIFEEQKKLFFNNLENGGCKNICNYFFEEDGKLKVGIKTVINSNKENELLKEKNEKLEYVVKEKEKELNTIYSSKAWKLAEKLRKIKHKIIK